MTTTTTTSTSTTTSGIITSEIFTARQSVTTLSIESILDKISFGKFTTKSPQIREPLSTTTTAEIMNANLAFSNSTTTDANITFSATNLIVTTSTIQPELKIVSQIQTQAYETKILKIDFDYINIKYNTINAYLSNNITQTLDLKIINKTDIYKGIQKGAVYLHPNTGLILDMDEKNADMFCLTSKSESMACDDGWTVSFWLKVYSEAYFDKTIMRVDVENGWKFFILQVSNHDLKVQFLFERKLWMISNEISWMSEWSLITLTWTEFDGLTVLG